MTDHDIICFSSIDWDFIWQGHQQIMETFARQGNRVLFVENTGVRTPNLRDIPRLWQRLHNWRRSTKGFRQVQENLWVYSPVVLPFPYSWAAQWVNRGLILRALRRWMRVVQFRKPVAWLFLPTPLIRDVVAALDPKLTVYYCIDDFASSSRQARRIAHSEAQVFQRSDLVFVTSHRLKQRAEQHNARVHFFPFGVDFERFEQIRCRADSVPEELHALSSPVVGYIGGLHRWVDQDLLVGIAERMPSTTFVLVGPAQTDVSRLAALPNVRLLGSRPHKELPQYIKGFTVGIVPYHLSEYTANVYPTKLNEYLAMGIPVVATDLPEIRRFNTEHGEVISVAQGIEAFAASLQKAVADSSQEAVQQRIGIARQNSWAARIARMSSLMEEALDRRAQRAGTDWEVTLSSAYRTVQRRSGWVLAVVATLYLCAFHTPFVWIIGQPLRAADPLRHADAIVVFGGGVGESGRPGQGYEERVQYAASLYHQGYAPQIVFSSGFRYTFQEPEVMGSLAVSLGVPPSAILLETNARGTLDNVRLSANLLREHGLRSAIVVSSPFHMRRIALVWRRAAPDLAPVLSPVPYSRFFGDRGNVALRHWRAILQEYVGIAYYWMRGWI